MATNTLKKITSRAKAIRKKQPGIKWTTAIKRAGAEYRGGKIKTSRKKVGKKKKLATRRVGTVRKKSTRSTKSKRTVGSVASHKAAAKAIIKEQLAWNLLNVSQAKTKTSKRKLQKRSAKLKKELRALS